jgi:hypothetical protein
MSTTRPGIRVAVKTALLALILGVAMAGAGCGALSQQEASTGVASTPEQRTLEAPSAGAVAGSPASQPTHGTSAVTSQDKASTTGVEKLVVVNKTLRLEVGDVNGTLTKLRAMTRAAGGDITNLQVSTQSDQPVYPLESSGPAGAVPSGSTPLQASVTIRVPTKGYADFVDKAAALGKVLFQSENAEDVTQQHVDMQARLRNLQAEEIRFRQFLKKARTVREALEVERELERVRGEIQSLKAQLDYLERQAAMATVTIELAEPQPIVRPQGQDWGFGDAITTGIQGLVGLIRVVIVVVLTTLPIWLPGILIAWAIVVFMRHRRSKKAAEVPEADPDHEPPAPGES